MAGPVPSDEAAAAASVPADAPLRAGEAGGRIVRGGILRTAGYAAGTVATTASSVILLRYLGVVDVGRYVTVMAVLAITSGLTEGGLTTIGQREYTVAATPEARRRILADIVTLRLVLTPLGVLVGTGFGWLAGYDSTMVLGILVGGIGVVLATLATTLTMPLSVDLRLGAVTATEVGRQVTGAAGMAVLALAGAGLLAFFALNVLAGLVALVLAAALAGAVARVGPRWSTSEWSDLLREAAPVALSTAMNVLYLRVLVVLMSLLASDLQTGYFATSYRAVEVVLMVPMLMVGSAFPVLAHTGAADPARFGAIVERLAQATLLVAGGIVLALALGAKPVLDVLGGSQYDGAVAVLRIQCFALLGAFLTQVWVSGLIAVRRQRALVATNLLALAAILVLGFTLIPAFHAVGAAVAAVAGEAVLATTSLVMLLRARPGLRLHAGFFARFAVLMVLAGGLALLSGLPDAAAAALAVVLYAGGALALRLVPPELTALVRAR